MSADRTASHGASSHGLRGDYSRMRPDYTVEQDYAAYTEAQQDRWRRSTVGRSSSSPVAPALSTRPPPRARLRRGIPRFEVVNRRLGAATGWQLVAVPRARARPRVLRAPREPPLPVTVWLREEHEFDYIVEPDVFHDFFGHVPMLFDPVFAGCNGSLREGGTRGGRGSAR